MVESIVTLKGETFKLTDDHIAEMLDRAADNGLIALVGTNKSIIDFIVKSGASRKQMGVKHGVLRVTTITWESGVKVMFVPKAPLQRYINRKVPRAAETFTNTVLLFVDSKTVVTRKDGNSVMLELAKYGDSITRIIQAFA